MPVRIRAEQNGVALRELPLKFERACIEAVDAGMTGVANGLLQELRQDIGGAFPRSRRMPTTITGDYYPAEGDKPPAVLIHPRKGSNISAVLAGHQGSVIASPRGKLLAIPLRGVPRSGNDGRRRQMGPKEYERRFGKLIFVPAVPGAKAAGYLAAKGGTRRRGQRQPDRYQVLYVLVRDVTLPARLKPLAIVERWADIAPRLVDDAARRLGMR